MLRLSLSGYLKWLLGNKGKPAKVNKISKIQVRFETIKNPENPIILIGCWVFFPQKPY